jgi:alpha-glucosidase
MKLVFVCVLITITPFSLSAQDYVLRSPNGKTEVRLKVAETVSYSIYFDGKWVVGESRIGLTIKENPSVGSNPKVVGKKERKVDQMVTNIVPEKRRRIRDVFNELQLSFQGSYGLIWRAYDSGVAYRWTTNLPDRITISNELAEINLSPQDTVYYPEEESFQSHNERKYIKYKPAEIGEKLASLATLVATQSGIKLWLSEADLYDYAGMWVRGTKGKGLRAVFPNYPLKEAKESDRNIKVAERADYIAQTSGTRQFPWRVFGLAERDADLLDNQLVFLLSEDTKQDFSWVKPGKVAWDWWNANNIYGVDFKSGINTATYKYFIDFAAKYGLEYVILDEGWSRTTEDLLRSNPDLDLPELLAHAKAKNVGIILWVLWEPLDRQLETILDQYQKWGVKGVKVDFMQRDDQKLVNYYERVAREAAKRKLLVDFHGAYKPTGMKRKYPNVITSEGVVGLEHNKWSRDVTPEHNLTLPFIRMVAGPMDYTPGAMVNATGKDFQIVFNRPMSQGTRCHQLAMYVIYDSPLQMLADNPSNYLREPETMEFLSAVPTVWDETVVIDGKIGEYAVMARRTSRGEWFIGAMNNSTPKELEIDLSFLDKNTYDARILEDGINADRMASDFERIVRTVTKNEKLKVKLAGGGGFVARLTGK